MTCVAGVVADASVWMGGDSATADENWALSVVRNPKVFRRDSPDGPWLIGFTWSWRMGQLLEHSLALPPLNGRDLQAFMATAFVDAVRTCLREGGFATKDKEVETGGTFMAGHAGRLFVVHADYHVAEPVTPFAAIGCGADLALGAMHALNFTPPRQRILAGLDAAETFNAGVRRPFVVREIP